MTLEQLPSDLPVPVDDGGADHLLGKFLPSIELTATDARQVDLSTVGDPWAVIFIYPRTGRPDEDSPPGWAAIPGARGCTPQTCGFRDHHDELASLGAEVYGLSTQATGYQQEMVARLHVSFPVLSDADMRLGRALDLPTFDAAGMTLYKRLTLIVRNGKIEHVMYPVFPPDQNAADVVAWLRNRMAPKEDARKAWNERYAAAKLYGLEPNRFVADELGGLSSRRVLDMACGQGRNAVWLATQGHQVTGLDLSDVAIAQAGQLAQTAGVEVSLRAVDLVDEWEPEGEFDLVVLSYLQLPPEKRTIVHAKAIEALAPGGEIFLIAHHADNLEQGVGGPPTPDVLFSENQLAADFGELDIFRNEKVLRPVDVEGEVRQAHDVLLRARKPA